jgi:hypothetical protein
MGFLRQKSKTLHAEALEFVLFGGIVTSLPQRDRALV